MNMEKTCKNCQQNFTIEPEDFAFYERINVPPPTWCWECRFMRRIAARPSRTLYKDNCDLCKKEVVSEFHPESPFPVYCTPCWYSDNWDALSYGQEYDFSKPFFEQFRKLQNVVPREATRMKNSPGSRYCQATDNCKNCYMLAGGYYSEDCLYGSPIFSRTSVDCDFVLNATNCYESVRSSNIFKTHFSWYADDCLDSTFLFDCKGCTSCFGCVNIRGQQYRIFNKQYTKDEYHREMEYWDLGSYARFQEAQQRFRELYLSVPHRAVISVNVVDVVGNDLHNTKNCNVCFATVDGVENCRFVYAGGLLLKDSYDVTSGGDKSQLLYDTVSVIGCESLKFCNGASQSRRVEYSERSWDCVDVFGSVNLRHKKYCILNKQYSKEEYKNVLAKIVEKMKVDGEYGEFFPPAMSIYPYNLSWASEFYPLSKDQIQKASLFWYERKKPDYVIDVTQDKIPDHVRDADKSFAQKVIECGHRGTCNHQCTTAFRVIPEELEFLQQQSIALPRLCPNCRFFERYANKYFFHLYHRKCANCPNEFETTYAPDRPEIIYCDACYKAEFL